MDLSLQQMRMLQALSHHGTIAAAAEALGYTPSAVSQQLSALERSAGVAVLERVGRNVLLTAAGRELVVHASLMLAQMEQAQAAMERVRGEVGGTITLGVMESVASAMLARLLEVIAERHPHLRVRTRSSDFGDQFAMLRSGELDLAFVVEYPDAPSALPTGISRQRVLNDSFHLVVPEGRVGEFPELVPLEMLEGEPFIAPPVTDPCGVAVLQACRRAGFEMDAAHQLVDYPVALRMVSKGVALSLVPDLGLRRQPEGIAVLPIAEPFYRAIDLAFRTASAERPAVQGTIQAVRDVIDEIGFEAVRDGDAAPLAAAG
ncbi:MAG: LysR family transcriptional regulator [Acidimicrobiales bacterium]